MEIQNKTILVLGGWGLVGSALIRKLVSEDPKKIIISSLRLSEAQEAVEKHRKEFPDKDKDLFAAWGGDIFVRNEFKELSRQEILDDPSKRKILMMDIMEELSEDILHQSSVYQLLTEYKPDIIIDAINTATAIA